MIRSLQLLTRKDISLAFRMIEEGRPLSSQIKQYYENPHLEGCHHSLYREC